MNIHEYQAKNLLRDYGAPVSDGHVATTPDEAVAAAGKLKLIQSISAGTDQYDRAVLRQHGIRLASAAGVNAEAVAEHAIALILALARRLPEARDNQHAKHWRGMIGDLGRREDQLTGKTLLVVGLGRIGGGLAVAILVAKFGQLLLHLVPYLGGVLPIEACAARFFLNAHGFYQRGQRSGHPSKDAASIAFFLQLELLPVAFYGGFIVGLKSAGRTILEPGISAAIAVIIALLISGNFGLLNIIAGGLVPFIAGVLGGWLGERRQGTV